jgi:hypothetical protein
MERVTAHTHTRVARDSHHRRALLLQARVQLAHEQHVAQLALALQCVSVCVCVCVCVRGWVKVSRCVRMVCG